MVVNSKKIRRLMREHDLQPKRRRRFVATTDSDHDNPIFPDLARDRIVDGPNQLWVADITYIAIATGFVYLAAILDAWSRRVVGYAISRSIDARVAVAALKAAIRIRQPPKGCIHHSDRGSQYASEPYRHLLAEHGLVGRWDEIGADAVWIIPASKTKNKRLHSVPLPKYTMGMINNLPQVNAYVFTLGRGPIASFDYVRRRLPSGDWQLHDLRRTCRSGMAACATLDEIAERVVNHAPKSIISVYNKYDYRAEKLAALEAWTARLLRIVA